MNLISINILSIAAYIIPSRELRNSCFSRTESSAIPPTIPIAIRIRMMIQKTLLYALVRRNAPRYYMKMVPYKYPN